MKKHAEVFVVMISGLLVQPALGRDQHLPQMHTVTSSMATTTTMAAPQETIQTLALKAKQNTNKGKMLANAAMVVTAIGAATSCPNPKREWKCKIFLAGLAASVLVRMNMSKASGKSQGTAEAVTTSQDLQTDYDNGGSNSQAKITAPDYTQEPDYKNAKTVIDKVKKDGWKVDVDKGTVTDPSGKSFSTGIVSSPASMRAAGASEADIKDFQNAMSKIPALAEEKAKAADASDMFSDAPAGGGGSVSVSSSDNGMTPYGNLGAGSGPKLGIDRSPAQVAGMKKDFNGDPIGISQDSLFEMVVRRYQLHQKNGSFLSQ